MTNKDRYKGDYQELNLLPEVFKISDLAEFLTISKTKDNSVQLNNGQKITSFKNR